MEIVKEQLEAMKEQLKEQLETAKEQLLDMFMKIGGRGC